MYLHLLERLNEMRENHKLQSLTVVTQYEEILDYLHRKGIAAVKNNNSALGISSSLKLGLRTAMIQKKQHLEREQYYMFFVADQPFLKKNTVEEFVSAFLKTDRGIEKQEIRLFSMNVTCQSFLKSKEIKVEKVL